MEKYVTKAVMHSTHKSEQNNDGGGGGGITCFLLVNSWHLPPLIG